MTPPFHAPRSFDPSYSLLGRAVRAWTGDRLRGEALYIVVLTGLALGLLMSHYLSWALLEPFFVAHPSWQTTYWTMQVLSVLTLASTGLIGFRSGVTVSDHATTLSLEQGARSHVVPYDEIERIETISPPRFHRHYRRYAATTVFVSQLPDELLLLHTADGPVVVALPDADEQAALHRHLHDAACPRPAPVPQA